MVRTQHALLYCRPGSAAKALTTWVRMWPSGESGLLQVGYGLNGGGTERLGQQMDMNGGGAEGLGESWDLPLVWVVVGRRQRITSHQSCRLTGVAAHPSLSAG